MLPMTRQNCVFILDIVIFLFVAGAVLSVFYEQLMSEYDLVPITIAYGSSNRGKSKAAKLAVAACGNPQGVYTDITPAAARKLLGTAAPFLLDDPDDTAILRELLITTFGGAELGTAHALVKPRTAPIITANLYIIESLSEDEERYM